MKHCILVLCAALVASCNVRRNFGFHVRFDQAVGLKAGDHVRMQGVQVGTVESVSVAQLSNSSQPVVDVAVSINDPKVQVRKGDTFRIATEGLLGPEYLEIDPGSSQSPPIPSGSRMVGEPISALPSKYASSVQTLMEIANKLLALPPDKRKLMLDKILKVLDQAAKRPENAIHAGSAGRLGSK